MDDDRLLEQARYFLKDRVRQEVWVRECVRFATHARTHIPSRLPRRTALRGLSMRRPAAAPGVRRG